MPKSAHHPLVQFAHEWASRDNDARLIVATLYRDLTQPGRQALLSVLLSVPTEYITHTPDGAVTITVPPRGQVPPSERIVVTDVDEELLA